jgi:hypothetical protein
MSILQTSMLSTLGKLADWGNDTYKAARNAMKGMGQDSKYFASSKKGMFFRMERWCTKASKLDLSGHEHF